MSSIKLFGNTNRQRPAARQDTGSIETVPEREAEEAVRRREESRRQAEAQHSAARAAAARPAPAKQPAPAPADPPKKKNGAKIALIVVLAVIAVLLAASAGFGIYVSRTDTVFPGVCVDGVLVGGLTKAQAADLLRADGWADGDSAAVTVLLPLDKSVTVTAAEAGAAISAEDAAQAAFDYCHGSNIFSNLITYVKCWFSRHDVTVTPAPSADAVRAKLAPVLAEVKTGLMSSGTQITDKAVLVVKGAKAVEIDEDAVVKLVTDALSARDYGEKTYDVKVDEAQTLDVDALYESIHTEAQDAYYDKTTGEVVDAVEGRDFDRSQAQSLWDAASFGDTVTIPLTVTEPELTTGDVQAMLFRDELSTATTSLSGSSANRIGNVKLAAGIINGTELKPGETFSYNDKLGQRTAERGFKYAGAYSGGQVVQEIGGGICQLSSTIYYCTLLANLKIVERTCHYFPVGYLPAGLDATVSWKTPNFRFTNSRDYPIRIEASVDTEKNTLTVRILGTDVDGSYVKMTYASWLVYNNKEYPDVATGYKAATYRWVYDKNDALISKTLEAYSEYHYHDEDIKLPESPSPSPSESPAQSPSASPSVSPAPSASASPSAPAESASPSPAATAPAATTPAGG